MAALCPYNTQKCQGFETSVITKEGEDQLCVCYHVTKSLRLIEIPSFHEPFPPLCFNNYHIPRACLGYRIHFTSWAKGQPHLGVSSPQLLTGCSNVMPVRCERWSPSFLILSTRPHAEAPFTLQNSTGPDFSPWPVARESTHTLHYLLNSS